MPGPPSSSVAIARDKGRMVKKGFVRAGTYVALVVMAAVVIPPAASAGSPSGITQSTTITIQLAPLPPQTLVELCLNEECQTVSLPATSSADLKLMLTYTLRDKAKLPEIDADGPMSAACAVRNADGTETRRIGAAIEASGASFTDQSSLQLVHGQTAVAKMTPSRRPSRTDAVSAQVCLL